MFAYFFFLYLEYLYIIIEEKKNNFSIALRKETLKL